MDTPSGNKPPSRFDRPAQRPGRPPSDAPHSRDSNREPYRDTGREPPRDRDRGGGGSGTRGPAQGPDRKPEYRPVYHADSARHRPGGDHPEPVDRGAPPADLVTGLHPVMGLLQHAPQRVQEVLLWSTDPRVVAQVRGAAEIAKVPVSEKNVPWFDNDPSNPQGVAVRVTEFAYTELDRVIPETGCPAGTLILILDSITDPRNLGAILRSAAFFGVSAVIVPQDRAAGVSGLVERVSRAATATLPVVRVVNLARTIEILKERGVFVVGTALEPGCEDLAKFKFAQATALVLGAEGSGLRPLVRKKCDILVKLEGLGPMQSLNVSAFATLALHLARQQLPMPAAD